MLREHISRFNLSVDQINDGFEFEVLPQLSERDRETLDRHMRRKGIMPFRPRYGGAWKLVKLSTVFYMMTFLFLFGILFTFSSFYLPDPTARTYAPYIPWLAVLCVYTYLWAEYE